MATSSGATLDDPRGGFRRALRRTIWFLSHLVAVAMILGVISPWLADHIWLCEIACHFQVQYVVGLTLLAIIFAASGRRRFGGGILFAAMLAFVIHWLPFYWSEKPAAEGPRSLRLLSMNLRFDIASLEPFFELVNQEQPDVILLFELSRVWAPHFAVLEQKYPHFRISPSPGHSGCGIYSKLPLEEVSIDGFDGMFVVNARASVGDKTVRIFGPHPFAPYTPKEAGLRNLQLANLAERVGQPILPTIIAGDFNTSSWSPCFGRLMRATGTRDTRRGFGVCSTFPVAIWPLQTPIDHCLVTPNIGVIDRRVGPDIGSDHLPILIDLRLH